jgi:hypothetical protein
MTALGRTLLLWLMAVVVPTIATPAFGHDTSSGWGGAFKERIGLTDDQYTALMQHKADTEASSDKSTGVLDQIRELLIQDPEADVSPQLSQLMTLLTDQAIEVDRFFSDFSGELNEEQREAWVNHTKKRKQKKEDGKLPKR